MKWNSGSSSNLNALENGSWDDMANASNDMNKKSRYADGGRVKNCAPSSLSALDRGDWGAMANESCQMEQSFHGFADGGSVNESQINPGFNQGFNTSAYAKGGSVKKDAQKLKHMGRDGDTELIHVNKAEERMLKAMGGRGSVNPKTGLREYPRTKHIEEMDKKELNNQLINELNAMETEQKNKNEDIILIKIQDNIDKIKKRLLNLKEKEKEEEGIFSSSDSDRKSEKGNNNIVNSLSNAYAELSPPKDITEKPQDKEKEYKIKFLNRPSTTYPRKPKEKQREKYKSIIGKNYDDLNEKDKKYYREINNFNKIKIPAYEKILEGANYSNDQILKKNQGKYISQKGQNNEKSCGIASIGNLINDLDLQTNASNLKNIRLSKKLAEAALKRKAFVFDEHEKVKQNNKDSDVNFALEDARHRIAADLSILKHAKKTINQPRPFGPNGIQPLEDVGMLEGVNANILKGIKKNPITVKGTMRKDAVDQDWAIRKANQKEIKEYEHATEMNDTINYDNNYFTDLIDDFDLEQQYEKNPSNKLALIRWKPLTKEEEDINEEQEYEYWPKNAKSSDVLIEYPYDHFYSRPSDLQREDNTHGNVENEESPQTWIDPLLIDERSHYLARKNDHDDNELKGFGDGHEPYIKRYDINNSIKNREKIINAAVKNNYKNLDINKKIDSKAYNYYGQEAMDSLRSMTEEVPAARPVSNNRSRTIRIIPRRDTHQSLDGQLQQSRENQQPSRRSLVQNRLLAEQQPVVQQRQVNFPGPQNPANRLPSIEQKSQIPTALQRFIRSKKES